MRQGRPDTTQRDSTARDCRVEYTSTDSRLEISWRAGSYCFCDSNCGAGGKSAELLQLVWTLSSAGSERVPYKHEVTGSIPVASTIRITHRSFLLQLTSLPSRLPDFLSPCKPHTCDRHCRSHTLNEGETFVQSEIRNDEGEHRHQIAVVCSPSGSQPLHAV